jgi:hemerythrin superfamily protein
MTKRPFELSTGVKLVNLDRKNYTESEREASIKRALPWAMRVVTEHQLAGQASSAV